MKLVIKVCLTATLVLGLARAWAQESLPATSPAKAPDDDHHSSSRLIEEIVVTAQKREENLQDVPISITALSAGELDAKGVLTEQDLPLVTPGLTLSTSVNFLTIFLRGLGSDAFLVADPSVANYVDGIYFPFSNGAVQDFGAVQRIEVLKGPQGTLFGRNAVGGAINVITKAPSLTAVEASVQTSLASYDTWATRVYASVPITHTLAASASLIYDSGRNYVDGTQDGQPLPSDSSYGARVKVRWAPAAWIDATGVYLRLHQEGVGSDYAPNAQPSPLGAELGIKAEDPYAGAVNEDIFFHHNNSTAYGQVNLTPGPVDIKVLGGHQDLKSYSTYDFDGSTQPLVFFQIEPGAAKVDSAELQILSNADTWEAKYFKWIVGAYYFKSISGFPHGFARLAGTDLSVGRVLGVQLPQNFIDAYTDALAGTPAPTGAIDFVGVLSSKSYSGFGQGTISFTDWLSLTLGGRYQTDSRFIVQSSAGTREDDGMVTLLPGSGDNGTEYFSGYTNPKWRNSVKAFKPKASLEFRPDWSLLGSSPLLYLSYQQAIKDATFNVVNLTNAPDFVKSEELTAYEAGAKTRLFHGLVTFNTAVFDYELRNPQVQFVSVLEGGVIDFENAGKARVRGAEFDTVAQLLPSLTDGLVLTASSTFLDPIYTSYKNGTGFNPSTGILTKNMNFDGHQIQRSPRYSGTIGLSQTFNAAFGPIELAADYYRTSRTYFLAQNTDISRQNGYGVISAHASYLYEPWKLRVTAFGKNIGNARYSNSLVITDFGRNEARAELAVYGMRFNYDF